MSINLVNSYIRRVDYKNKLSESKEFEIEVMSDYSFKIAFFENDNTKFVATLLQNVKEKSKSPKLSIKIELVGMFSCEGIENVKNEREAHIEAYNMLFPYVQSATTLVVSLSGLPPLYLPKANVDNIEIHEE